jgi:hypothetical protein
MKKKFKIYGLLLIYLLFSWGCTNKGTYAYRSKEIGGYKKPVANVEKVWRARHKYDHERRLLIPMVGGSQWGATQEYKEDGTLEYKDWWERDIKIEDLEPTPSTALKISQNENVRKVNTIEGISLEGLVQPSLTDTPEVPELKKNPPDFIPIVPSVEDVTIPPVDRSPFLPEDLPSADSPFDALPNTFPPLDLPGE